MLFILSYQVLPRLRFLDRMAVLSPPASRKAGFTADSQILNRFKVRHILSDGYTTVFTHPSSCWAHLRHGILAIFFPSFIGVIFGILAIVLGSNTLTRVSEELRILCYIVAILGTIGILLYLVPLVILVLL